jgi:hypothetical protein
MMRLEDAGSDRIVFRRRRIQLRDRRFEGGSLLRISSFVP